MDDAETAWLAGLLEGEGSFMLSRNIVEGKLYLYPKIVVTMTDRDVVARVATLFGTSVYSFTPRRAVLSRLDQHRAQVTGTRAVEWMHRLYPWMGDRRRRQMEKAAPELLALVD